MALIIEREDSILMNILFIFIILTSIAALIIYKYRKFDVAVTTIVVVLIIIASYWYFTSTEVGKREVKDFTSNVSGGIPRYVRVYDVNGELIEEYTGTFDMETNHDNYILFDDENGLRHIIYFTTGTIIIDEVKE